MTAGRDPFLSACLLQRHQMLHAGCPGNWDVLQLPSWRQCLAGCPLLFLFFQVSHIRRRRNHRHCYCGRTAEVDPCFWTTGTRRTPHEIYDHFHMLLTSTLADDASTPTTPGRSSCPAWPQLPVCQRTPMLWGRAGPCALSVHSTSAASMLQPAASAMLCLLALLRHPAPLCWTEVVHKTRALDGQRMHNGCRGLLFQQDRRRSSTPCMFA